jgi:hypothetical protein
MYGYIVPTSHVSREHNLPAILWLQCVIHLMLFPTLNVLYFYISTFPRMCAVPIMAVVCSSLMSCVPGMLLGYFLNDFEMVSLASVITDTTSAFTFHIS